DHAEPVHVGPDPAGAVDDDRWSGRFEEVHPGEFLHVPLSGHRQLSQLGDGLPGIGQVHLGAGAREADPGVDGYVPVDHSHVLTVPTRTPQEAGPRRFSGFPQGSSGSRGRTGARRSTRKGRPAPGQEHPQSATSAARVSSRVPVAASSLAMKTKTSSRPSASRTVPARVLTPFSVPVLPRTSPAPCPASPSGPYRSARVPVK